MNLGNIADGASAAIVCGGTALGVVLRCGLGDCRLAAVALVRAFAPRFHAGAVQARLAVQVQDIQRNGLIRAEPQHFDDSEFDEATAALIGHRSLDALLAAHAAHRARRAARTARAAQTVAQAAELAPVFGLAGTLISLGRLPADGLDRGAYMAAIAMAVHATLYGLVLANLVLAPFARRIERAAGHEEAERQRLVDWLAQALAPSRTVAHAPGWRGAA
ncbi:MAG: MotA/TolQ/ExbB proton channel family protein [Sphingomonadales bacterium]|nr:MotA/TolQ/ExbB proton channel family protein [Sphingomonadales bacterium]